MGTGHRLCGITGDRYRRSGAQQVGDSRERRAAAWEGVPPAQLAKLGTCWQSTACLKPKRPQTPNENLPKATNPESPRTANPPCCPRRAVPGPACPRPRLTRAPGMLLIHGGALGGRAAPRQI